MTRLFTAILAALAALHLAAASGAPNSPTKLELHTQDDDLRGGGVVWFVLRMNDGTEQSELLVNGTGLAGGSTREFQVAPKPPYTWSKVREFGLRARPHPGDGLLLQPDQWKVYVILRGVGACSADSWLPVGEPCFGPRNGRMHFQREDVKWVALNVRVGQCDSDIQCIPGGVFCAERTRLCKPGTSGADEAGCVRLPAPQPACGPGFACNEAGRRCVSTKICDADRDGSDSIECGGNDCDDNDPSRRPGRTEVCDVAGHDEDCNAETVGTRDSDGDGHTDAACWNDGRQFDGRR